MADDKDVPAFTVGETKLLISIVKNLEGDLKVSTSHFHFLTLFLLLFLLGLSTLGRLFPFPSPFRKFTLISLTQSPGASLHFPLLLFPFPHLPCSNLKHSKAADNADRSKELSP